MARSCIDFDPPVPASQSKLVRTPAYDDRVMLFGNVLREELRRRQTRNRRYSLRAFARDLGLHHSTLSRLMRGTQRAARPTIAALATKLRLAAETIREGERGEVDRAILRAIGRRAFRPDCRWIAAVTGLSLDTVNASLHRLLRDRALRMDSHDRWTIVCR
jgi:transcriptional regulator with XRE-family HTH domain